MNALFAKGDGKGLNPTYPRSEGTEAHVDTHLLQRQRPAPIDRRPGVIECRPQRRPGRVVERRALEVLDVDQPALAAAPDGPDVQLEPVALHVHPASKIAWAVNRHEAERHIEALAIA
jgi:hypothetical protein